MNDDREDGKKLPSKSSLKPSSLDASRKSARRQAELTATKIVSAYPNVGDIARGYVVALIEHLEQYPPWLLELLVHPTHGIAAKCKFVPSIAEIAEFATEKNRQLQDMDRSRWEHERRKTLKPLSMDDYHSIRTGREAKYQPFPKVWDAFRDDPEAFAKLNSNLLTFETLSGISKTLAMQGQTAARTTLMSARLSDPARGHKPEAPRWLTHPDPNAPWRKQGPPSPELRKLLADDPDYQANLAKAGKDVL